MVSSVQPSGFIPLTPLPTQTTQTRPERAGPDAGGDAVALSRAADLTSLTSVQGEIDGARTSTDLALAAGREGAGLISQLRDLARSAINADDGARADLNAKFQTLLQKYGQTIDGAIGAGADLLAGNSLTVALDPDSPPVTIAGYDLRLKQDPATEDALRLSTSSNLLDQGAAQAAARDADASLARVDTALSRLSAAGQRLSAHDQFLSALDEGVSSQVSEPPDADGARLLALRVRQGLQGDNAAIANSAPQSLLALFRE
ncbi:MAG TPA: hypothetical protein VG983_09575 [Caulobacterales bacterium]|nr:hypothetical protein [Caulobacterales bacterium]